MFKIITMVLANNVPSVSWIASSLSFSNQKLRFMNGIQTLDQHSYLYPGMYSRCRFLPLYRMCTFSSVTCCSTRPPSVLTPLQSSISPLPRSFYFSFYRPFLQYCCSHYVANQNACIFSFLWGSIICFGVLLSLLLYWLWDRCTWFLTFFGRSIFLVHLF